LYPKDDFEETEAEATSVEQNVKAGNSLSPPFKFPLIFVLHSGLSVFNNRWKCQNCQG